jgi:hypothetical protein
VALERTRPRDQLPARSFSTVRYRPRRQSGIQLKTAFAALLLSTLSRSGLARLNSLFAG